MSCQIAPLSSDVVSCDTDPTMRSSPAEAEEEGTRCLLLAAFREETISCTASLSFSFCSPPNVSTICATSMLSSASSSSINPSPSPAAFPPKIRFNSSLTANSPPSLSSCFSVFRIDLALACCIHAGLCGDEIPLVATCKLMVSSHRIVDRSRLYSSNTLARSYPTLCPITNRAAVPALAPRWIR